jgi:hypothetical protein
MSLLQLKLHHFYLGLSQRWTSESKLLFQRCVRRSESCKQLLALNVYPEHLADHYDMVSELNIICRKNRSLRIE